MNKQGASPDNELVETYKKSGDLQVLSELYQRYMDLVYGVCLKYLADKEDARDAVMNIFEELVLKLRKHEVHFFKSWLHEVTKNHCLMLIRSSKKSRKAQIDISLMQNDDSLHLNGELDKEENFIYLQKCIGLLADDQKRIVDLFYLKGKCYNEIVNITGLEWNKIRSSVQNGRRNLKLCIDKQKVNNG